LYFVTYNYPQSTFPQEQKPDARLTKGVQSLAFLKRCINMLSCLKFGKSKSYDIQTIYATIWGKRWLRVWYCAIFLLTPEAIQVFADFFIKGGLPGKSILGNERRK
jgi:hypothetical protein